MSLKKGTFSIYVLFHQTDIFITSRHKYTNTNTDANTDINTDTKSYTDTNTKTDTYTNANANIYKLYIYSFINSLHGGRCISIRI